MYTLIINGNSIQERVRTVDSTDIIALAYEHGRPPDNETLNLYDQDNILVKSARWSEGDHAYIEVLV